MTCFRFLKASEVRAQEQERSEAEDTEDVDGKRRKRQAQRPGQRPKVAMNFTVESLSVDAASDGMPPVVVGTSDGRMLLLKVTLEKGKPTCSMLHDVSVMQVSPGAVPPPRGQEGSPPARLCLARGGSAVSELASARVYTHLTLRVNPNGAGPRCRQRTGEGHGGAWQACGSSEQCGINQP